MNKNCKHEINDWISWIENEKRLSKNTIASYHRDLQSFMSFLKLHLGKNIEIADLQSLFEDDLTGWFYKRINSGISHRSNARALSSVKSFLRFLSKKKKLIQVLFCLLMDQSLKVHFRDPYQTIKWKIYLNLLKLKKYDGY